MIHQDADKLLKILKKYAPRPDLSDWGRLEAIISANIDSQFGQQHGFSQIDSVEAYRSAVPVRDYGELEPRIQALLRGETSILTTEAVIAFERTSGSTGKGKWIPYTESLRIDFASALSEWLEGIACHIPSALEGKAYWALSPRFDQTTVLSSGISIKSDGDYFPNDVGQALVDWLVVPASVTGKESVDQFFERSIDALLMEPDLSFISVWSPTFFLELDNRLKQRRLVYNTWKDLWPKLALISCWADAGSARWISRVRELSGVFVEPKGLLSTEGVISIPKGATRIPALFRGRHFIEFICLETDEVFSREELVPGASYSVVLTTSGGLYRYRTGDLIEVICNDVSDTIQIRFIGREGTVSDLVGEKLDERFVANVFVETGSTGFLSVAEEFDGYILWMPESGSVEQFIHGLRANVYMAQAWDLGQLKPIRVRYLTTGWEGRYVERVARIQGCRLGDVKLPILLMNPLNEEIAECLTM